MMKIASWVNYSTTVSGLGAGGYPSKEVLTRRTRRLDPHIGSGRAVSTLFQTALGPLPTAFFPEAELL